MTEYIHFNSSDAVELTYLLNRSLQT